MTIDFAHIRARAEDRKGGPEALLALLPPPRLRDLSTVPDSEILSRFAQHIFSAGFVWRVVEAKWPGTTEAFGGFDLDHVASLDDEGIGALAEDTRLVRNRQKIVATVQNARWMREMAHEHGSFGAWLQAWPEDDPVGLWTALAKDGKRLGGNTGPYTLRGLGKDTFMLTDSVTRALTEDGVMTAKATSKTGRRQAQEAFIAWKDETGLPFATLSRIVAYSVP
ncbi:MAG: 3-methyladenine DNA glycosylase Tag [Myxococcota bacterium]|jgi:3-methyladenine DNA glycosylase Tag